MAAKISLQKGSMTFLTVVVSYGVSLLAAALANHGAAVAMPADTQIQLTVAATAVLTGVITGAINWWKHKGDKKPLNIDNIPKT